ncbi:MAG: hypothetical protein FD123_2445 [Bacteroidetes bacterium]|nr:MAG: hypothetical protein FD123_2445 [Bacteroidota bacterium]
MVNFRKLSFVLLLLFSSVLLHAQVSVIRVTDPVKNKTRIVREGDWLRAFAFTDSTYHEGRITYIGEKGVQLEGHTYQLEDLRLVSHNSRRREVTADVADFAGETCMMVGGLVFRVGVEFTVAADEKAAVVIGLPVMGVGGALWITGAIAHGIVYPILASNTSWKIADTYKAELSSDTRRRKSTNKRGDEVYDQ